MITTRIEQDGVLRNGAVTRVVTVADGSVSNIDIGLIEALKFDMNLSMGISKITTNTSKETLTKTYENSKLTKTEIAAKQVAGSTIYIEYTFTVKNEGEIAGFVKKVADYVPEGMEGRIPYKGNVCDTVYQIVGGLRSAMGYCGCANIDAMKKEVRFTRITNAGLMESHPHNINITKESPNYFAK